MVSFQPVGIQNVVWIGNFEIHCEGLPLSAEPRVAVHPIQVREMLQESFPYISYHHLR